MTLNGSFRFHPVGQGLFYTGLLSGTRGKKSGPFSFVYDCGTKSSRHFLEREIDDFKLLLPHTRSGRRRLDLLIVSHMHDDHVNGLEHLLDGLEVDTVVIPYADHTTNLLSRLDSSGETPFLSAFYADPVDWLSSKGVERIMLVGSPPEDPRRDEPADGDVSTNGEDGDIGVDGACVVSAGRVRSTALLHLRNDALVTIWSFQWQFRFRNLRLPQEESCRRIVDEFQCETMMSLDEIFRSRTMTKRLARRLREVIPDGKTVNRTSVVVTHGPAPNDGVRTHFFSSCDSFVGHLHSKCHRCYDCGHYFQDLYSHCHVTILTGDIEVRDRDEADQLWDSKQRHAVFQYPHHGAKGALPREHTPHEWLSILSVGLANQYVHPHPSVLWRQSLPVIVDERQAFDYRIMCMSKDDSD